MKQNALSAGIIPVMKVNASWHYLLLRSYNYWDFPKGVIEQDEDPWTGALRELQEETGIIEANPRWGKGYYETEAYSKGKVARYFLAEVKTKHVTIKANPVTGIIEHHEHRWVTYKEAYKLLSPRVQKALIWAYNVINS